jgi:hypothetical protein
MRFRILNRISFWQVTCNSSGKLGNPTEQKKAGKIQMPIALKCLLMTAFVLLVVAAVRRFI